MEIYKATISYCCDSGTEHVLTTYHKTQPQDDALEDKAWEYFASGTEIISGEAYANWRARVLIKTRKIQLQD